MYAEVGPQIRPVTVMPPSNDNIVQYTSLIHDESRAEDPTGIMALAYAICRDRVEMTPKKMVATLKAYK